MNYRDIRRHLVPYRIFTRRKTTINHAFAAAVAPCDDFAEAVVRDALKLLDQDPDGPLTCVYCDGAAETWDHVFATVKASVFSGAGHRLGNLVPCCKPCNSKKGNRSWQAYIASREAEGAARDARTARLERYLRQHFVEDKLPTGLPEYARLMEIRNEVLQLMREADEVAAVIRERMRGQG